MKIFPRIALAAILFATIADSNPISAMRGSLRVTLTQNGGVLLNLAATSYFNGYSPYLNWWKSGSALVLVSSTNGTLTGKQIWDNGTYFNTTTGELLNPMPADVVSITRGFFTPVNFPQYQYEGTSFANFAGQAWNVTWDGCSTSAMTVSAGGSLGTGGTSSFSGNAGTITLGSSGYSNVAVLFTPTAAGTCYTNPPHNIKVFQSQYATNVAAGQTFNPDWINDVKQFGFLRLMDWMQTNGSGITDSSQLADLTFNSDGGAFLMAWSSGSSISGTTLTVGGFNTTSANFQVGETVVASGLTVATTITGLGSGTGGNGSYTIACAGGCPTLTSRTIMGIPSIGTNASNGPKGGVSPSLACALATATGNSIEYPIPIAATNQFVTDISTSFKSCMPAGTKVKYSFGNENWNPGFFQFYYNQALIANGIADWQGYRAAQMMDIIYNIYGSAQRSRWVGSLGSQLGNTAFTTSDINGANAAISAGGLHTLTQLFDQVDVAPYWGMFIPGAAYKASCIQGITVGANPTVNAPGHTFINGQTVAVFVNGGTMASVLNSNAVPGTNVYATVSNVTTNTFDINISTVGLTYGGGASCASGTTNYAMDATIPKLADQSTALNVSTPATYPTKFSYFAQQMSKAILNGSATDASYGTLTIPTGTNLSNISGSIQNLLQQQALLANSSGLNLGWYEGGAANTPVGVVINPVALQMMEFLNQSNFYAGATGDSTNTPANLYAVAFAAQRAVKSAYPAQFNELAPQAQFGPWGALRFTPGDESNPRWAAITTENALGPYIDPQSPATWSVNYNSATDHNFGSSSSTTLTCPYTAPINGLAVVAITFTSGASITSVTIDGGAPMNQDALTLASWTSAIFSQPVTSGSHTVTATFGTAAPFRSCYALTLNGLASSTVQSVLTNTNQKSGTISEIKGSFIIAVGALTSPATFATASSASGTVTGNVTTVDNQSAQASGIAYWSPGPSFTSAIFGIATSGSNGITAAAYR